MWCCQYSFESICRERRVVLFNRIIPPPPPCGERLDLYFVFCILYFVFCIYHMMERPCLDNHHPINVWKLSQIWTECTFNQIWTVWTFNQGFERETRKGCCLLPVLKEITNTTARLSDMCLQNCNCIMQHNGNEFSTQVWMCCSYGHLCSVMC